MFDDDNRVPRGVAELVAALRPGFNGVRVMRTELSTRQPRV